MPRVVRGGVVDVTNRGLMTRGALRRTRARRPFAARRPVLTSAFAARARGSPAPFVRAGLSARAPIARAPIARASFGTDRFAAIGRVTGPGVVERHVVARNEPPTNGNPQRRCRTSHTGRAFRVRAIQDADRRIIRKWQTRRGHGAPRRGSRAVGGIATRFSARARLGVAVEQDAPALTFTPPIITRAIAIGRLRIAAHRIDHRPVTQTFDALHPPGTGLPIPTIHDTRATAIREDFCTHHGRIAGEGLFWAIARRIAIGNDANRIVAGREIAIHADRPRVGATLLEPSLSTIAKLWVTDGLANRRLIVRIVVRPGHLTRWRRHCRHDRDRRQTSMGYAPNERDPSTQTIGMHRPILR